MINADALLIAPCTRGMLCEVAVAPTGWSRDEAATARVTKIYDAYRGDNGRARLGHRRRAW